MTALSLYPKIATTENSNHQKSQVNHPIVAQWLVVYYGSFLANFDGWNERKVKSLKWFVETLMVVASIYKNNNNYLEKYDALVA